MRRQKTGERELAREANKDTTISLRSGRDQSFHVLPIALDRNRAIGLTLALLAVVSGSVAPALIKLGVQADIDSVTLLVLRLWMSALMFWLFFAIAQPSLMRIDRYGLRACVMAGVVNSASLLLFYLAIERINASTSMFLFSFYPVFAVLILALRGEKVRRGVIVILVASLLGVYLLVGKGGPTDPLGVLLMFGNVFGYALHMNLVQWYLGEYPAQTVGIYVITTMAVLTTAAWLVNPVAQSSLPALAWVVIAGTALIATVIMRLALFASIRRIGSAQTALFGPLEVLLSITWAVIFLEERLAPVQWAGGALILAAMIWSARRGVLADSPRRISAERSVLP